jgi:peptidoglycan/xylan/chitin deacetylase (PgdA/CDA1 family)
MRLVEERVAPLWRGLRRLKNRALSRLDTPLIVLAYHRVAHLAHDPYQLAVTPEHFRAQMGYLRDHCHCLRGEAKWSELRTPAVVVTFDDGYADNLHQALPILTATGIPATFFISTGQLDSEREFWSDELARLLQGDGVGADFELLDSVHGGRWPAQGAAQREALQRRLQRVMLKLEAPRREEWLQQLRDWRGSGAVPRSDDRALTRAELCQLANSPLVTIGAHGVTHTPLTVLAAEAQLGELVASREELQRLLGREVDLFSYPFGGRGQFDRTTRRLCRQAGYRRAVTTFPGQVHRWSDPWQLPRQLVRNWDAATFAARMEGFWV